MDRRGTPARIPRQLQHFGFRTVLCFQSFKTLSMRRRSTSFQLMNETIVPHPSKSFRNKEIQFEHYICDMETNRSRVKSPGKGSEKESFHKSPMCGRLFMINTDTIGSSWLCQSFCNFFAFKPPSSTVSGQRYFCTYQLLIAMQNTVLPSMKLSDWQGRHQGRVRELKPPFLEASSHPSKEILGLVRGNFDRMTYKRCSF